MPASIICAFSTSNAPNVACTASPSAPVGSPPPFGESDVPEQRVVGMAAAVVPHRRLLVGGQDLEVRDHGVDRSVHPLGAVERRVEVRHVRGVMLAVVDLHRLRVDVRLERVERVGQFGQFDTPFLLLRSVPVQGYAAGRLSPSRRFFADAHVHRHQAARAEAGPPRARRHLARLDRGSLPVVSGLRRASGTRSSRKLEAVDRSGANQVYSELRALKVDLSFAVGGIKNHEIYFAHLGGEGGDPTGAIDGSDRARLRLGRCVARGPQGDRDRRPRLGLDGVRLGRASPLQLHRRCPEHVPGLERDAAGRARRLRARLLPRLPDRPRRLHRCVLREPRLERRQRLDRLLRHPGRVALDAQPPGVLEDALIIVGGLPGRLDPLRCRRRPAAPRRGHPQAGQRQHRRVERVAHRTGAGSACRSRCSTSRRASCPRSSA